MYSKSSPHTSREHPETELTYEFRHASFTDGQTFSEKKNGRLPVMGWNSWNAFGTGNNEKLTKIMADKIVELGLDKLGYKYVVLDDGCYLPERVEGRLSNEPEKFPSGFKGLADYIHSKNLKFGMYNDIGTNLCAGSAVGTCGFEDKDAESYAQWDIDFLKVDNCYYLWDNATFSNPENARYSYSPSIKGIKVEGDGINQSFDAVKDGVLVGLRAEKTSDCVTKIGTFDGTNTGTTPVGKLYGELHFTVNAEQPCEAFVYVDCISGKEEGCGQWLQVAVGEGKEEVIYYDDFVSDAPVKVQLKKGKNVLRFMNHRRQENVLAAYGAMFYGLQKAKPGNDIILSICEWGKTQPHNWGHKLGNSWRILNDITFNVGADGNPGQARWFEPGTASITSQYNKAVVMDEYAGLNKGWNDPDMLVIGMDGVDSVMAKTHMTMWCMMNSPLMLGLDLRRVTKGDDIYNIIANKSVIDLNQDKLGIQAKRVWCSLEEENPDTTYITNNDRIDILVKPLSDGDFAVSFINLSEKEISGLKIDLCEIEKRLGNKLTGSYSNKTFELVDLWTGEKYSQTSTTFCSKAIAAHDNYTIRVSVK